VFVTSTSGFSLMHATSIKPVGVGLVFSALICAGFCHRKERERNGRGQQSCDIDYEEEKNSKQQNAQSIKRTVPHRNRRRGYFPRTNRTNSATFSCRTRSCTRSQFLRSLIILLLLLSPRGGGGRGGRGRRGTGIDSNVFIREEKEKNFFFF
jgi:hypothetical protein